MGESKKKFILRFDSIVLAASFRLAKTALLNMTLLISNDLLIHIICTHMIPASDSSIIKIKPMNLFLLMAQI
jgi:hypothetical protein